MKRKITLLILIQVVFCFVVMAQRSYTCSECNGTGEVEKYSYVTKRYETRTCSRCYGKGTTSSEGYTKPYGHDADDYNWRLYLSPEEQAAVNMLEEQLNTPQYEYSYCKNCDRTGVCPVCHGADPVTVYSDGCMYCQGSGMCRMCGGKGYLSVDVKPNPNRDQILAQLAEYMKMGNSRQVQQTQGGQGQSYGSSGGQSSYGSSGGNYGDNEDYEYSGSKYVHSGNDKTSHGPSTAVVVIVLVAFAALILFFRKKKKS